MAIQQRDQRQVIIVGGVAGGMSCATRLRRLDEDVKITVIERSGHVSFANCGLPYYVGGVISQRNDLLLQTPEALAARFNIDVLVNTTVTAIDPESKTVTVESEGTTRLLPYDQLVLSPGAHPVIPPIPGIDKALVLRNVEDTDKMAAAIDALGDPASKSAVVIGGGFIGLEVAENLRRRGLRVHLVEAQNQVMTPLDVEMAGFVHAELRRHGVELHLGTTVTAISDQSVTIDNDGELPADLVVAAIGVRPETSWASEAGVKVGPRGGIAVDATMLTSNPDIYAIGDAVEKIDALYADTSPATVGTEPDPDAAVLVPLANTANRQGRVLADILADRPGADRPVLGTAIVSVFDLTVATTGWSERRLRARHRPFRVIHTHPMNHASYYPGAEVMALKLLVDPQTDRILGAQAVGGDGVDKRIDVLATAIAGGITASRLADLELAYAPKYGSAKDPINMLGYVNLNLAQGVTESIQWHELAEAMNQATLIDVRTPAEFTGGAIPGAINIPVDELRQRLAELPAGELIVHCAVGIRGHIAARILAGAGRSAKNLDGGYRTWVNSPAANPDGHAQG